MRITILMTLFFVLGSVANGAVLLEDGGRKVVSQSRVSSYGEASSFRGQRRVGVGAALAGSLGVAGVQMELNFTPDWSGVLGYGGGGGFQAYHLQVKHMLGARSFAPYFSMGLAQWFRGGEDLEPIRTTNPGFLADKFLSPSELQSGEFSEFLLFPAFGVQYFQMQGQWTGTSVYLEVLLLADVDDFVVAPTGALGFLYYF